MRENPLNPKYRFKTFDQKFKNEAFCTIFSSMKRKTNLLTKKKLEPLL